MHRFTPSEYGHAFAKLLDVDRRRSVDAGRPDSQRRDDLEAASVDAAFDHANVVDRDMARCCLAGVWLLYDFLDESHTISQGVSTPTGSFWHGIMHRREGDYSNAKYWFRRVGGHEIFPSLAKLASSAAADPGTAALVRQLVSGGKWSPAAFIDACQSAASSQSHADFCRKLQQMEWELLFDHCYRHATGP